MDNLVGGQRKDWLAGTFVEWTDGDAVNARNTNIRDQVLQDSRAQESSGSGRADLYSFLFGAVARAIDMLRSADACS